MRDGFQRAIRCGDSRSCQLPSRWRKAAGNDYIRNSCMVAFSEKFAPENASIVVQFLSIFAKLESAVCSRLAELSVAHGTEYLSHLHQRIVRHPFGGNYGQIGTYGTGKS